MEKLPPEIIQYLLIPAIILVSASLLVYVVRKSVGLFLHSRSSFLKVDPTNYSFLSHSISFLIYLLAVGFIIYTIPELRELGAGLFAGAGIVAAILAFASQAAFSNIISGIFIVIFRPFRVGDIIEIDRDQFTGTVEDITLRHTVIRDFENKRIITPNSMISNKTIVNNNIGDERIAKHIEIGISYDSDVDLAISIIQAEAEAHPLVIDPRTDQERKAGIPMVRVRLVGLEEYSVKIRAWVWSDSPLNSYEAFWDLLKTIKRRFEESGIEIPYPHRTIVYKSDTSGGNKKGLGNA